MNAKLLLLPFLSLLSLHSSCSSKSSSDANDEPTPIGFWLAETVNLEKVEDASSIQSRMMITLTEDHIQVYDLDGQVAAFDGTKHGYILGNAGLSSSGYNRLTASIAQNSNAELRFLDFKTNDYAFSETTFKRINLTQSLQEFRGFSENSPTIDYQETKVAGTPEFIADQKNLNGFWVFAAAMVGDQLYTPGQLLESNGERIPEQNYLIHFKDGQLIVFTDDERQAPVYRDYDVADNFIVAEEVRQNNTYFSRFKLEVERVGHSSTAQIMVVKPIASGMYSVDSELFVQISDEMAKSVMVNNSVFIDHFTLESSFTKDDLAGFWLFKEFMVGEKSYDLNEKTPNGEGLVAIQNIFHFKDGKIRQYFNNRASSEIYLDFSINGKWIIIPNQKTGTNSSFVGKKIRVDQFYANSFFQTNRTVTPDFVEGEVHWKISDLKAQELLENNYDYPAN